MRTHRTGFFGIGILFIATGIRAQNDNDHFTTNGLGQTHLATDAQATAPPVNVTIGTTAAADAALQVRTDQLVVLDPDPLQLNMRCAFRTDVQAANGSSWRMYRDVLRIGAIWNERFNLPFHLQSLEPPDIGQDRYSGVMVQNNAADGLWVMHDGGPTGGRTFPDASQQLLNAIGFVAVGENNTWLPALPDPQGPWSRFHLFHNNMGAARPQYAFRTQMRNGVTFTGNSDHAYVGQWYDQGTSGTGAEVDDNSNLVLSTAENVLPSGVSHRWDNISFRFFSDLATTADGPSSTVRGLEIMRIQPVRPAVGDPVQGYVGIGGLTATNGPEERLDILSGRLRIRDLPTSNPLSNATQMMVVNGNGIVGWQSIGGAAFSCEWVVNSGAKKITTAYQGLGSNGTCPELDWRVGIGTNAPQAKLHAYVGPDDGLDLAMKAESNGLNGNGTLSSFATGSECKASNAYETIGAYGEGRMPINTNGYLNTNSTVTGVSGLALIEGKTYQSFGGKFISKLTNDANAQATEVFGAFCSGWSTQTSYPTKLYGLKAQVQRASGATYPCYAVFGDAPANPTGGPYTSWAAYLQGDGYISGLWNPSDADLKENMELLQGCGDILAQVHPYTYTFRTAQYPTMRLPEGPQSGIRADELQGAIPHLVRNVFRPADLDSLGNEIAPAMEFQAVNYLGMVPYILGAVQELRQENVSLREQLNACCAINDDGTRSTESTTIGYIDNTQRAAEVARQLSEHELLVTPNPFQNNPTISYRLATGGRAQLRVSDARSQQLGVLLDAGTEAGQHSMVWNTVGMAAGTYWLTLTVDGKRVTEQAVKVE